MTVFGGKQKGRSKIGYIRSFLLRDFIILLISSNMYTAITAKEELGLLSIQFITNTLEGIPFNQLYQKLCWLSFLTGSSSTVAARKPFVAAIDGPAFGGALEIALVCSMTCFDSFFMILFDYEELLTPLDSIFLSITNQTTLVIQSL